MNESEFRTAINALDYDGQRLDRAMAVSRDPEIQEAWIANKKAAVALDSLYLGITE